MGRWNFKELEGQLARWLEKFEEFQFEVVHRKGKVHCNADALSHIPDDQQDDSVQYPLFSLNHRKIFRIVK